MNKKKTSNKKAVKKTVRKAAARPAAKKNVKTKAAKGKAAPPKRAADKKTRPHAKTATKPDKNSKQDQTPASMRKTVGSVVMELLAEKSDATFDEALAAAKSAKPDTKFDKKHFAWYRSKMKKERSS